jgi:type 1 glutamine amidotransferase
MELGIMRRPSFAVMSATLAVLLSLVSAGWAADASTTPQASTGQVKILVLTGNEYPSHKWRETAPWIAKFLMVDPRLTVDLNTDPAFLASPELAKYDAIVLNYLNWLSPDPGEKARENLKTFVAGGKGLVLVHNAVAAFGDQWVRRDGKTVGLNQCGWPEVKEIFGRAWNPNRVHGHDPRGTFTVEFTAVDHPITQGMKSFETVDELYTCLFAEGRPVEVLATAMSKVENKPHPMVLVNHYGKGRVFLSVLGHDVEALSVDSVQDLYRRGTAWAAGIPPVKP